MSRFKTGCDALTAAFKAQFATEVTSEGKQDRRVLSVDARAILREAAKKAAQDAGKAALKGEI